MAAEPQSAVPPPRSGREPSRNGEDIVVKPSGINVSRALRDKFMQDPALQTAGMPPNWGNWAVPHTLTIQGLVNGISKTYRISDDALNDSFDHARFMEYDIGIWECIEARTRSVVLLDWHLEGEDDKDPEQVACVEQLTKILKFCPRFMQLREQLMLANWYGRSAVQIRPGWDWIGGKPYIKPIEWLPIHGDKLVFRLKDGDLSHRQNQVGIRVGLTYSQNDLISKGMKDDWGNLLPLHWKVEPTDRGLAYFLDESDEKLLCIHKHQIQDGAFERPQDAGRIHGVGIRNRIYWEWFMKQNTLQWLMEYIERSAFGLELWFYPMHNEKAKSDAEAAVKARTGPFRNVLMVPIPPDDGSGQQYGVQHVETGLAGADLLLNVVDKYFGHRIKRLILGQTLTTEADATGLGSGVASIHLLSFRDIVKYDSINLQETITDWLNYSLKPWNFPNSSHFRVRFVIETEPVDADEKLSAMEKAWQMGARIKERDVLDAIGAAAPTPADLILPGPSQPADPMGEGGGAAPGEVPGDDDEDGEEVEEGEGDEEAAAEEEQQQEEGAEEVGELEEDLPEQFSLTAQYADKEQEEFFNNADQTLNKGISKHKFPDTLYHITHKSNVASIKKNGLKPASAGRSEIGVRKGTYLTEKPSEVIGTKDFAEPHNYHIFKVKTKGLKLRLDPEMYAGGAWGYSSAEKLHKSLSAGTEPHHAYTSQSIPSSSVEHLGPLHKFAAEHKDQYSLTARYAGQIPAPAKSFATVAKRFGYVKTASGGKAHGTGSGGSTWYQHPTTGHEIETHVSGDWHHKDASGNIIGRGSGDRLMPQHDLHKHLVSVHFPDSTTQYAFDESKHPRGQPDNAGQFVEHPSSTEHIPAYKKANLNDVLTNLFGGQHPGKKPEPWEADPDEAAHLKSQPPPDEKDLPEGWVKEKKEPEEPKYTESQIHFNGTALKQYLTGKFYYTELQLQKIEKLNPHGLSGGKIKVPKALNDNQISQLSKILPAGTHIKRVSAAAHKLGLISGKGGGGEFEIYKDPSKHFKPGEPHKIEKGGQVTVKSEGYVDHDAYYKANSLLKSDEISAITSWKGSAAGIRKAVVEGNITGKVKHFLTGVDKLPKFKGTTFRGFDDDTAAKYASAQIKAFNEIGVGGVWLDNAPMGMSRNPNVGLSFASGHVLLKCKAKTARAIEPIDGHSGETEHVAMPGTKWRITRIVQDPIVNGHKLRMFVELEEI